MGGNSYCLLLTLAFATAGCAKTQTLAPSADASAAVSPTAQSAAAAPCAQSPAASPGVQSPAASPGAQSVAGPPSTESAESAPKAEEAATLSAEAWLALIDQGNYAASWHTAAGLFQHALAPDEWASKVASARDPLGKLVSRQIQTAKFTTSLPGVPDGKYVVITFSTSFQNKQRAIETVTPMQDERGAWRVAGYFIR